MLQSRIFVGMVLILIFGEVLGLYGQVLISIYNAFSNSLANAFQSHRGPHLEHEYKLRCSLSEKHCMEVFLRRLTNEQPIAYVIHFGIWTGCWTRSVTMDADSTVVLNYLFSDSDTVMIVV